MPAPTTEQQLAAVTATLGLISDGHVPHGVNGISAPDEWNMDTTALLAVLPIIGGKFTAVDAAIAAMVTLFDLDHDPTTGIGHPPSEWVLEPATATYVDASHFTFVGDRTGEYGVGQRLRVTSGGGFAQSNITVISYNAGTNRTTVQILTGVLTNPTTQVFHGLVRYSMSKLNTGDIVPGAVDTAAIGLSATSPAAGRQATLVGIGSPLTTSEITVANFTITTRGGPVTLRGDASGYVHIVNGSSVAFLRLKMDGQPVLQNATPVALSVVAGGTPAAALDLPWSLGLSWIHTPGAGAHVYSIAMLVSAQSGATPPVFNVGNAILTAQESA